MTLWINDVEFTVLHSRTNRNVLHPLLDPEVSDIAYSFRRAIAICQAEGLRWCQRRQLFSTSHEHLQRVVLDTGSKLVCHLCSHKSVGDTVLLEIVVQGYEVETQFLGDNMQLSTNGEC